ncbi:hypothetical protein BD309DRAFT_947631 [Dichomitus squalens]|uniref:Uncharacterized protein n=1 Tax=Dichomitus squalens TaxID=114155 RepID=A0A4Q9Q8T5_9APHY|nr:hypothetical protein BD309DRAFT_947631 [Dichomitus squalens]TBU63983.1 hypothetical protein BD310DRAFT_915137 [Dichomitus squalens]
MNPNNSNSNFAQIPLPTFMNMMGGILSQSPHAPQTPMPQGVLQMQPGSAPTFEFIWQGWQQAGQQWLSMTHPGSQSSQQAQMSHIQGNTAGHTPHQSLAISDLAAFVTAMQPLLQNANPAPVGSVADDERILISALKEGKAEGLTPRQALDKLHNVNNHTESAWKNYFLDHLDRLYAKAYPSAGGHMEVRRQLPSSVTGAPSLEHLRRQHKVGLASANSRLEKPSTAASSSSQRQRVHEDHIEPLHRKAFRKACAALDPAQRKRGSRPIPLYEHGSDSDYSSSVETESSGAAVKRQKGILPPQRITEEDLRAMARFRVERPPPADISATGKGYWEKFARQAKKKRTPAGWARASISYEEVIEQYIAEHMAEIQGDGSARPQASGEQEQADVPSGELPKSGFSAACDGVSRLSTFPLKPRKRPVDEQDLESNREEKRFKSALDEASD